MDDAPALTSTTAILIAIGSFYLAVLVAWLWPTSHLCHDDRCPKWQHEQGKDRLD